MSTYEQIKELAIIAFAVLIAIAVVVSINLGFTYIEYLVIGKALSISTYKIETNQTNTSGVTTYTPHKSTALKMLIIHVLFTR